MTSLREICVNHSCTDELRAPLVANVQGLSVLSLVDPSRAILQLLPEWLERISDSLRELHFLGNCGSITPGVLRSFVPHLKRATSISLGLSYSLADADVFAFIGGLPQIRSLQLQHYLQLISPPRCPPSPKLRTFIAKYSPTSFREEVNRLCQWIKCIIATSPIETLRLICGNRAGLVYVPNVSFDGLVSHIVTRHATTIRILDLRNAFVGIKAFKDVLSACRDCIEELYIYITSASLSVFLNLAPTMTKLHTVVFRIFKDRRQKYSIDPQSVNQLFKRGPPLLRSLTVNESTWEASWISISPSEVQLSVNKVNSESHIADELG